MTLETPVATVEYLPPPGWECDPRPPVQRGDGCLYKHLLRLGKKTVGLVAVSTARTLGTALENDAFLALVAVEGGITGLEKRQSAFCSGGMDGCRWEMDFFLDGTPFVAELFALRGDGRAKGPEILVSCWGAAEDPRNAEWIARSISCVRRVNPARKRAVALMIAGFLAALCGLLLTAITYDMAASGDAPEYVGFVGLVVVGTIVFLQGIWRLLSGRPRKSE